MVAATMTLSTTAPHLAYIHWSCFLCVVLSLQRQVVRGVFNLTAIYLRIDWMRFHRVVSLSNILPIIIRNFSARVVDAQHFVSPLTLRPLCFNMLLRVRSNVGTWKYSVEPLDGMSEVVERIRKGNDDASSLKWRILGAVSRDPAGKEPLAIEKSLDELGIAHGSMVYCRVEPFNADEASNLAATTMKESSGLKNHLPAEAEASRPKDPPVIDLLESSDDENTSPAAPRESAQPKKRQRMPSNGTSERSAVALSTGKRSKLDPSTFQIASYNVWFGPQDPEANQVHPEKRMAAIARELESCEDNLLFIGFQELTESLRRYLEPHLKRMGYRFCTQPLGGAYGVGLAISKQATVVDSKFVPYNDSIQGRGLLYVQTPTMLFGTSHLESFIDGKQYDGAAQREAQIVQAATFCQERLRQYPNLQLAMIAGDFNWDDERKRAGNCPNTNLLELLHSQGCGTWKDAGSAFDYTYDGKENPMLGNNLRRRFDRCVYLASPSTSASAELHKLGMTAIPSLTWNKRNTFNGSTRVVPVAPSDHFGIAVTFRI